MISITKITTYGNKYVVNFSASENLHKYFLDFELFFEYEFPVHDIPEYILIIPAIANLVQIAWFANCDISVPELDSTFADSLESIKKVYNKSFSSCIKSSNIICKHLPTSPLLGNGSILLFSGGLDSTAACLSQQNIKSHLLMVDFEPAGINKQIYDWSKYTYGSGSLVRTNIYSFLNRKQLDLDFGALTHGTWWGGIQHGMGLISLAAPLSYHVKARYLSIASTHDMSFTKSWGSDPSTDNLICWLNSMTTHVNYDLSRQQKIISIIKPHIQLTSEYPNLAVCNSYSRDRKTLNCSKCAKCAQAIIALCVESIDPSKCGFMVDSSTFSWIKESLESMSYFARESDYWTWQDVHARLLQLDVEHISTSIPGAQSFLRWFQSIDLTYSEYFNNTAVMRDRPRYSLCYNNNIPYLVV